MQMNPKRSLNCCVQIIYVTKIPYNDINLSNIKIICCIILIGKFNKFPKLNLKPNFRFFFA